MSDRVQPLLQTRMAATTVLVDDAQTSAGLAGRQPQPGTPGGVSPKRAKADSVASSGYEQVPRAPSPR